MTNSIHYQGPCKFSPAQLQNYFKNHDKLTILGLDSGCLVTEVSRKLLQKYKEICSSSMPEINKREEAEKIVGQIFNRILLPIGKNLKIISSPNGSLHFGMSLDERAFEAASPDGNLELLAERGDLITTSKQLAKKLKNHSTSLTLEAGQRLFLKDIEPERILNLIKDGPVKSLEFSVTLISGYNLKYKAAKDISIAKGFVESEKCKALVIFAESTLTVTLEPAYEQ